MVGYLCWPRHIKGKSFDWAGLIYAEARQCQEAVKAAAGSWICTWICVDLHGGVDFTLFMFQLIGTMFCGLDGEGIYGVRWLENSLTNLAWVLGRKHSE